MRSMFLVIAAAIACTGCAFSGVSSKTPSEQRLITEAFVPPKHDEWTMPNGLTVMYLHDAELPLVEGTLMLKGGSWWEHDEELGTVTAMGQLMRRGGAGNLSGDDLDRTLEMLAAGIGSSFGGENGEVSFHCFKEDAAIVMRHFADVIMRPRFELKHIDLWKAQEIDGIKRRVDDGEEVATISFLDVLYGESPYGRVKTSADVRKVSRNGLLRAHRRFVRPDEAILVITGDIPRAQVESLVRENLGSWQKRGAKLPPPPPINTEPDAAIIFVELPFSQANVLMGHLGVPRLTPDFTGIAGFNHILSDAGFGSKLVKRIRTELGYAYDTHGSISAGLVKGVTYVQVQTKAESTGEAIVEALSLVGSMKDDLVSDKELADMKASKENSFVFNIDMPEKIVARTARQRLLKFPSDYDSRLLNGLRSLSKDDILQVARARWNLGKLLVVVVGSKSAYNSLTKTLDSQPGYLKDLPLIRASFGEKLELPS